MFDYAIMYASKKPSEPKAAFGFCRDNEQVFWMNMMGIQRV